MPTKVIVISAVSFTEGGPMTVLRDCLDNAAHCLPADCKIVAIVHSRSLQYHPRIHLLTIPSAKKSWLFRLYWEWFGFFRLFQRLKPSLWLSLHDITPRLPPCKQVVYCHNPAPFYRIRPREALYSPGFLAFNLFYIHLYRMFVSRNIFIVVQQSWLRNEFIKRFGPLPIVVAHPSISIQAHSRPSHLAQSARIRFLYPALPRVFKNFEVICEAAKLLSYSRSLNFELYLTIDGSENSYARSIQQRYHSLSQLRFIGRQSSQQMRDLYASSDVVVFPSKLETWGLPLSEAKAYSRIILAADLPYARETIGAYERVSFFPADSKDKLAQLMADIIQGSWRPTGNQPTIVQYPFVSSWASLWEFIYQKAL